MNETLGAVFLLAAFLIYVLRSAPAEKNIEVAAAGKPIIKRPFFMKSSEICCVWLWFSHNIFASQRRGWMAMSSNKDKQRVSYVEVSFLSWLMEKSGATKHTSIMAETGDEEINSLQSASERYKISIQTAKGRLRDGSLCNSLREWSREGE